MRIAFLKDVREILQAGGWVRFTHATCVSELFAPSGKMSVSIDGRTYQGFLQTLAKNCTQTETGSLEKKNLVIEWRKK